LNVFDNDGEALKSGRYGIIMAYFAEVRLQRLTKNVFPSPMIYGIQLGAKGGPVDLGSILSTIFLEKLRQGNRDNLDKKEFLGTYPKLAIVITYLQDEGINSSRLASTTWNTHI